MNLRTIDQTKLLGFDMGGNPLFDLVVPAGQACSTSVAVGTVKADGIAKVAGSAKMVGASKLAGNVKV